MVITARFILSSFIPLAFMALLGFMTTKQLDTLTVNCQQIKPPSSQLLDNRDSILPASQAGHQALLRQVEMTSDRLNSLTITLLLAATLSTIIIALHMAKTLTSTLDQARNLAEQLAQGDLSTDQTTSAPKQLLLKTLSRIGTNLREAIKAIGENIADLNQCAAHFSRDMAKMRKGATKMHYQAKQVSQTTSELSSSLSTVASASKEIKKSMIEVANTAQNAAATLHALADSKQNQQAEQWPAESAEQGSNGPQSTMTAICHEIKQMSLTVNESALAAQVVTDSIDQATSSASDIAEAMIDITEKSTLTHTIASQLNNNGGELYSIALDLNSAVATFKLPTGLIAKRDNSPRPLISFNKRLNVLVEEMNAQHTKIFDFMNQIHFAAQNDKPQDHILALLRNLSQYTIEHFSNEESWLASIDYPEEDLDAQQEQHNDLLSRLHEIRTDMKAGKEVNLSVVMNFLKKSLEKHIAGADKKYGIFCAKQGIYH